MSRSRQIIPILILTIFALTIIGSADVYAQKISMQQWNEEMAKYQAQENEAKMKLADCKKAGDDLRGQIADADNEIMALTNEIYRLLGATQSDIDAFRRDLQRIKDRINGLLRLSSEELYARKDEADNIGEDIGEKKESKIARLPEMATILREIDSLYQRLLDAISRAKPKVDIYSVLRGDYLWRIAKSPKIYGDPYSWMRIYSFNRESITNPDLIYPDQRLKIHRVQESGQYVVQRGDNLSNIAGKMGTYSDPKAWRKIYDANKEIIADPNTIYPSTVLIVP